MARTIKPDEYASKRNEILETAMRLMVNRGFAQLTIQDVRSEIRISSGAFHHYFESRDALLGAIIERILERAESLLLPIVRDPHLNAIQKLQGFFGTLDSMRVEHKAEVIKIERIWYADENAVVRQKMDQAVVRRRAPLLNEIVHQGIQEGVFTIACPDLAGEIILSLLQGMGNTHARLLHMAAQAREDRINSIAHDIVDAHVGYMDAIERVLNAPPDCLYRADVDAVMVWVTALRED